MRSLYFVPCAALAIFTGSLGAHAATVTRETYSFDATLTSGNTYCGIHAALASACPDAFGTYSGRQRDDLVNGLSLGDTVSGMITLERSDGELQNASCTLGGEDCLFSTGLFARQLPAGSAAILDFSESAVVLSRFDFDGGTYFFATDYTNDEEGMHYYSNVRFSLTNVEYGLTEVPLPATAGLLLASLFGLGVFRRLRSQAS